MRGNLAGAGLWLAALAILRLVPVSSVPSIPCLFRTLTGLPCPLCGMTRAMFLLGQGEWQAALKLHPLSPAVFAAFVFLLAVSLAKVLNPRITFRIPPRALHVATLLFAVYGLARILRSAGLVLALALYLAYPLAAQENEAPAEPLVKVQFEIRGRGEAFLGLGYQAGNDNVYYLHRTRLSLDTRPVSWLRAFAQFQDSHAPGHRQPVPDSVADTFDMRQAFIELHSAEAPWSLQVGRQDLNFGEQRLVGASNWGNVGRSFDAVRLVYGTRSKRLDWFASSVVSPRKSAFDKADYRHRFYGFYSSFSNVIPGGVFEPYVLWKSEGNYRSERGVMGRLDVVTAGLRANGKLSKRIDFGVETAMQTGSASGDRIRAWAGHFLVGYKLSEAGGGPRLIAQYNRASGDSNPSDGRRGTFDNLYPTNHFYYGIADRIGWRNINEISAGIELRPLSRLRILTDAHFFWLGTVQDALYLASGSSFVKNPAASSRRIGDELDLAVDYQVTERFSLVFGWGLLSPRTFLKESTPGDRFTTVYAQWLWRLQPQ